MKLKSKLIKTLLISIFFINIFNSKDELQSYHSFTPTRGNLNKTNYLPTDATTVNLPIK